MPGLASQTLASFLEEVAAATPAPGGGSSAACTTALAAALVEMAAGLGQDAGTAAQAGRIRGRALELMETELASYGPVLEALRLPADDTDRPARLEQALLEASGPPLAIAQAAAEVSELGVAAVRASSASVRGDALTGTLLAEAAAAAAATLVEVNLARRPSDPLLDQAREARARASSAREAAEALG